MNVNCIYRFLIVLCVEYDICIDKYKASDTMKLYKSYQSYFEVKRMDGLEGKFAGTVTVGTKGQIVIPKEAREMFGIKPGDTLMLLADVERGIAIPPKEMMQEVAAKVFDRGKKMSKIVFFCIPAHGHTNPTLGVVRELIKREHEVWYYSYNSMREKIESTGANFVSCDAYDPQTKLSAEDGERIGKDLAFSTNLIVDMTLALDDAILKDMADVIEEVMRENNAKSLE